MTGCSRWWRQALFVLVTGGLVYMHGIDPSPTMAVAGVASAPTADRSHDPGAGDPDGGHSHGAAGAHAVALCLAILASAAAVGLARRSVTHPRRTSLGSPRVAPIRRVASTLRGPPRLGPPCLAVARC